MPHMSPMQWSTMLIGTWLFMNTIIMNNYQYKKLSSKMHNIYNLKPTWWNW